jgi:hypothetical protein
MLEKLLREMRERAEQDMLVRAWSVAEAADLSFVVSWKSSVTQIILRTGKK